MTELFHEEVVGSLLGGASTSLTLVRRAPEQAQWLDKVRRNPQMLVVAPLAARMDPEVVMAAVVKSGPLLRYAADDLKANRGFICSLAAICRGALEFAAE